METFTARLGDAGRFVIPAKAREKLGLKRGEQLVVRVENDSLRILTRLQAIREAQAIVRKRVPPGVSLADELIAERRAAAELE
jgi:AbrB family looped-hinge helix DNA binding protein